jgi:hypothetical protein
MRKLEIILGAIALMGLIMKFFLIPGGSALFVPALMLLATVYYLLGFALFNNIRFRGIFKKESYKGISAMHIIGAICTGFVLSVICVGILFKVQHYPGYVTYLIVGLIAVGIILIMSLLRFFKNRSPYYKQIFLRIAIWGILGLSLLVISESAMVRIQFRNHPDYIKAFEAYKANPQDEELKNKMDVEYLRATMSEEQFNYVMKRQNEEK